jgi:flagellar biosynthesis/type III secretory pathway M-ring protein FliF/YscJ
MAFADRWRALAPRSRLLIVGLVLAALGAGIFAWALQRDVRAPLFATPLRPEQIAEVAQRLAEWNVAFVAGADNVRVDARKRNELLLRLSLAGLPHPHRPTSSETLEKAGPLVPQSVLDAQQREGLAGDLAAALRGLDGVEDAQVIVAAPRAAAFADETAAPVSAGVRLSLRAGARLTPERIAGIRQFVADGVPGLDPAHVALLDDRGSSLESGPPANDDPAALQTSLQSALDEAFGAGATIVRVRLERDLRARELRSLRRAPLDAAPVSGNSLDERLANGKKLYTKRQSSEDRGSDLREERTDIPAGGLDRISVAIAVDAARELDLEKIRALAGATLGLVEGRDVLRVEAVPFARPAPVHGEPLYAVVGLLGTFVPPLALALGLVFAARAAARPLERVVETLSRRRLLARGTRGDGETAAIAPAHVRGALRDEPPHAAAAIISALPAATATAVLELYPPEERAAIVRRMQRAASPAVPDYESVLRRA